MMHGQTNIKIAIRVFILEHSFYLFEFCFSVRSLPYWDGWVHGASKLPTTFLLYSM